MGDAVRSVTTHSILDEIGVHGVMQQKQGWEIDLR
jgi:hypothetical protein